MLVGGDGLSRAGKSIDKYIYLISMKHKAHDA
jgi:hypothetical protein